MIIALYISPSNSIYFKDEYFSNLDLIYNRFRSYVFLIMGDLNSRVGTPTYDTDLRYFDNPDSTINSNGMELINWLKGKKDAFIVNGLVTDQKNFDSKFTFFRCNLRSQNDLLISNSQNILKSFTILNKLIYSDHTPTCTIISVNPKCSLDLLYECSTGLLNYNHYDVIKRKITPLNFSKIDWAAALPKLEEQSRTISQRIETDMLDNDHLDNLLASTIYVTCKENYKIQNRTPSPPSHTLQCNSSNLKAIAEINFFTYKFHVENGGPFNLCQKMTIYE